VLFRRFLGHCATDVDEIVRDQADQRFIPSSPLYRQRLRPCHRLATLMRPSHPVRHFWPLRNQRLFCSRLRSGLLVDRLGMHTRLTPLAFAVVSFLPEWKPASAATRCSVRPSVDWWISIAGRSRSSHWGACHRPRSRSRSGFRPPATSPSIWWRKPSNFNCPSA
jgi:hypothetical protein